MEARNVDFDTLVDWGLLYMGTPYSKYPGGIEIAFRHAAKLAGDLIRNKITVYSPIAHTHPVATYGKINPLDHDMWLPFDAIMMEQSKALIVAKMTGWEESYGLKCEIEHFRKAKKPIIYQDVVYEDVDPETGLFVPRFLSLMEPVEWIP